MRKRRDWLVLGFDLSELLDVDVQQLAVSATLVAVGRFDGVKPTQLSQPTRRGRARRGRSPAIGMDVYPYQTAITILAQAPVDHDFIITVQPSAPRLGMSGILRLLDQALPR